MAAQPFKPGTRLILTGSRSAQAGQHHGAAKPAVFETRKRIGCRASLRVLTAIPER
jgi:hypothetical protein